MTKDKKILIGEYQKPFSVSIQCDYGIGTTITGGTTLFPTMGNTDVTIHLCGVGGFDPEYLGSAFKNAAKMLGVDMGCDALKPERVILNDPATIVLWSDNSKTVTKCQEDDEYDPLFGIMACAIRKIGLNRVKVDAWEWVIEFLADNLMDPDECRFISDVLAVTADAWELKGVGEAMEPYSKCSDLPVGDGDA